jgi:DNA-binding GntR family transcriptional regulator
MMNHDDEEDAFVEKRPVLAIDLDTVKPLGEVAYEALRDAIKSSLFLPGERLMETELADEMGISRTPVREAMRRLETDGYVVIIPRKGSYVASISVKDIMDVFEIRTALEMMAARKAAERATEDEIKMLREMVRDVSPWETEDVLTTVDADIHFHSLLYKASRNDRLVSLMGDLREQINRFRSTTLAAPHRAQYALDEHRAIVGAIAGRDPDGASDAARNHVEKALKAMREATQHQKE